MSDLVSRVLGPIELVGGLGGATFTSSMEYQRRTLPVTLEIDHPGRLDTDLIETVDAVLENFDRMQPMIDGVLQRGVRNQSSRVHQLFEKWQSLSSVNRSEAEAGFLADLTPMALRFSPDLALGVGDAERMALTYGLASEPRLGEFVVRFIDGYGPELAP